MADLPSLLAIRPTEGLTPLPIQERILDFAPIMQALASMPQTSSTGKSSKKDAADKEEWKHMRLGFAQQMLNLVQKENKLINSAYRTFGADVAAQMPEVQAAEERLDIGTHELVQFKGVGEKEKQDKYANEVQKNQGGRQFHLSNWLGGGGLKRHDELIGLYETTGSANFDPSDPDNKWREDFDRAPSFYNEKSTREETDALFQPAMDKWNKTSYGKTVADAIGDAVGWSHQTGGSGNNYDAMDAATKQAMEYAGFTYQKKKVKGKDGEEREVDVPVYGEKALDITSPIVGGYLQMWLQQGFEQADGIYDAAGNLIANDEGITPEGVKAFKDFVRNDIESRHQDKRLQSFKDSDSTFHEQSPDAYNAGVIRMELDKIGSPTLFQPGVSITEDSGMLFGDMYMNTLDAKQQEYYRNPKNGYMTADGKPTVKWANHLTEQQGIFNGLTQGIVDDGGNTIVPPMYISTKGTDGNIYYKPNPAMFDSGNYSDVLNKMNQRLNMEYNNLQDELRNTEGMTDEQKNDLIVRSQNLVKQQQMFNALADKERANLVMNGTAQRAYNYQHENNVFVNAPGTTPEVDTYINTNMVGQSTNALPGVYIGVGSGFMDINGIQGGSIVQALPGSLMMQAPGMPNWSKVPNTKTNWQRITEQLTPAQQANYRQNEVTGFIEEKGTDGKWKVYEAPLDINNNITNAQYDGQADRGWLLPNQTQSEKWGRLGQQEKMELAGSTQAQVHGPTAIMKPVVIAVPGPQSFVGVKYPTAAIYQYDEQTTKAAIDALKGKNLVKLEKYMYINPANGQQETRHTPGLRSVPIYKVDIEAMTGAGIDVKKLEADMKRQGISNPTEADILRLAAGQKLDKSGSAKKATTTIMVEADATNVGWGEVNWLGQQWPTTAVVNKEYAEIMRFEKVTDPTTNNGQPYRITTTANANPWYGRAIESVKDPDLMKKNQEVQRSIISGKPLQQGANSTNINLTGFNIQKPTN